MAHGGGGYGVALIADRHSTISLRRRINNLIDANKALTKELETTKGRVRLQVWDDPATKQKFKVIYDNRPGDQPSTDNRP